MRDDWHKEEITPAAIAKFLEVHGKRGMKTLSILGRTKDTYNFVSSDIGRELLGDTMNQMEILLEKIIDMTAKEEEKIEYRVLSKFFKTLTNKVGLYLENQRKIRA